VYLYQERHSHVSVVGRFFVRDGAHEDARGRERMQQEFDNLHVLRGYGFAGYPHHVARPLGANPGLNSGTATSSVRSSSG